MTDSGWISPADHLPRQGQAVIFVVARDDRWFPWEHTHYPVPTKRNSIAGMVLGGRYHEWGFEVFGIPPIEDLKVACWQPAPALPREIDGQ